MGAERPNANHSLEDNRTLVFTYGTLKRGFSNHSLMQSLIHDGDAEFLGEHHTVNKYPLVCGPYRVPFLLNLPGAGERVHGELYAVSGKGIDRLDELEGTTKGHYERLPVEVACTTARAGEPVPAEAYYGHRSYAEGMWKRNGEIGFCKYTTEIAEGYVHRKDRPTETSFLDEIRVFVSSSSDDDDY